MSAAGIAACFTEVCSAGAIWSPDREEPQRDFMKSVHDCACDGSGAQRNEIIALRRGQKSSSPLHVKNIGPRKTAAAVIVPIQSDFAGAHRTWPIKGLVLSSMIMRSEPGCSFMGHIRVGSRDRRCQRRPIGAVGIASYLT